MTRSHETATYPVGMRAAIIALSVAVTTQVMIPVNANGQDRASHDPVIVAVLDTGISAHPDLGWRIRPDGTGMAGGVVLPGYDFVSNPWSAADGDGWDGDPSDRGDGVRPREAVDRADCRSRISSWHGTNVAGTIAARQSTARPNLGIAPDSRILPIRIMGRCGGNTADVAAGILWAVGEQIPDVPVNPNPADIINVSLAGAAPRCPLSLQTAIDTARGKGAVVVAAAGSSARDTIAMTPANCTGVVVVGAVDIDGERAPTSNFGDEVTLSALGGDMSTGERNGMFTTTNTGRYRPQKPAMGYYQSSSAAAARASGALAVLAARDRQATADQLIGQLLANTEPFAPGQCDAGEGKCGAGILNLRRIVTGN